MNTQDYSAFFVFGDSLSDNGAIFALTGGTFPPTALSGTDLAGNPVDFAARDIQFNQRFTNDLVYAEIAVDAMGIGGDNSTFYDDQSGSNFAVGGARASDLSAFGSPSANTLADQVGVFSQAIQGLPGSDEERQAFLANSAASVFMGLNDLNAIGGAALATGTLDLSVIQAGVGTLLAQYGAAAQTLAGTGVGTIVLNLLPPGSFFPANDALIAFLGEGGREVIDSVPASVNAGIQ